MVYVILIVYREFNKEREGGGCYNLIKCEYCIDEWKFGWRYFMVVRYYIVKCIFKMWYEIYGG